MVPLKNLKVSSDVLKSGLQSQAITDNEDALKEILLKLPIKDLLCLKCVSKQFCHMISDPRFGYIYYQRNPEINLVAGLFLYKLHCPYHSVYNFMFLNKQTPRDPFRSLSFVDANSDIHRIWSCNGLLCLCIVRYGFTCSYDYYICNPTTNNSIKLPYLSRPCMSRLLSMTFAFDPRKSPFYKVVCVWVAVRHYRFSIYSSQTKIWRDANSSLEVGLDDSYLFNKGVFWNNFVHWVSEMGPFLRFDADKDCFEKMPMTPIPPKPETRSIQYFGESHGHLLLMELRRHQDNILEIFEMERNYSEWFLSYRVTVDRLFGLPPGHGLRFKFSIQWIFWLENGDDLFGLVVSTPLETFLLYISPNKWRTEKPRLLLEKAKDMHIFNWYHSHPYIMTLTAV